MFRAVPCSSSGGQIVLSQHLLSALNRRTVQPFTESDDRIKELCIKLVTETSLHVPVFNVFSFRHDVSSLGIKMK